MRKLTRWGWGTLIVLGAIIGGCQLIDSQSSSDTQARLTTRVARARAATKKATKKVTKKKTTKTVTKKHQTGYATPTLFMHGFGGNAGSTNNLIDSAQADGYATRTLLVTVGADGKLTWSGSWPKSAYHPEIQIVFEDNRNRNYQQDAQWLKKIIKQLQNRYGITKFNYVGHSMGNTDIMTYETTYGQRKQLPQLQKYVAIAPPMLGNIVMNPWSLNATNAANGKPSRMSATFKELLANRQNLPVNQLQILSIYGNLDNGTNTDGTISVASAKSLRYLVRGKTKSFKEIEMTGDLAQHRALPRRNPEVVKDMEQFLWG